MSIFGSLEAMAGQAFESETHQAIAGALENSSLGGVSGLVEQLKAGGLGDVVSSWVSGGEQIPLNEDQLKAVIGDEHVQQFAQSLGIPTDQVLATLSQHLPQMAAIQAAAGSGGDQSQNAGQSSDNSDGSDQGGDDNS